MVALLFPGSRARRRDGEEPVQQSIHDLPGMQQIANRPQGCAGELWRCRRLLFGAVISQIRPCGGNERACAIRQHQCENKDASAVCAAYDIKKLSFTWMALPNDSQLRRKVVDASSVWWCLLTL